MENNNSAAGKSIYNTNSFATLAQLSLPDIYGPLDIILQSAETA